MNFDQESSKNVIIDNAQNGFLVSAILFTLAIAGVPDWSRAVPEELFSVLEAADVREFLGRLTIDVILIDPFLDES